MEEIRHKLKQNKPEITESSLKAYVLNLRKLHQRLHGSKDFTGLDWLQDHEGVMKNLEANCGSYLTCRNYLNAVIVALLNQPQHETALKAYQQRRDELNSKYTQIQQTKQPTERQSQNWVSVAEIHELIDELSAEVKGIRSKAQLTHKDLQTAQDRFMITFWLHYPVRNDLQHTRIIGRRAFNALPQEQKEGQNFMIQGNPFEFSVGSYKTRKRYGVKRITIDSKPVLKALRDWMRVSPNPDYVLVNVKSGEPMSSLQITQNLTRVFKARFDKSVGTTLLRHIVLTEKFGKQLQEMEELADMMGHDVSTAQGVYIKNPAADAPTADAPEGDAPTADAPEGES
jgi:hypothetical protein